MLGDFTAARAPTLSRGSHCTTQRVEQSSSCIDLRDNGPVHLFPVILVVGTRLLRASELGAFAGRLGACMYARSLGHAHSFGFALHWTWVARFGALAVGPERVVGSSRRTHDLFRSALLCNVWRALSLAFRGWCLAAMGDPCQGIPLITAGLAQVRDSGILSRASCSPCSWGDAHRTAWPTGNRSCTRHRSRAVCRGHALQMAFQAEMLLIARRSASYDRGFRRG